MHTQSARLSARRVGGLSSGGQRHTPAGVRVASRPIAPARKRSGGALRPPPRDLRLSATPPPRPPGPPSSAARTAPLRFAAVAATIAALAAAAAVAGRDSVADALLGDALSETDSPLRVGFVAGTLLWTIALRLVSIPQLFLLFIGRVDGARPVDTVERVLSMAAGPDGPTTQAELTAVRASATAVFLASGAAVATLLATSLGDDTWSVASGLGALAAGALFDLGRPRPQTADEAAAAAERAAAFAAWADGGALRRGGQCFEGEVLTAARRPGGPARGWTDEEVRAALRAWATGPGSAVRSVSRSAAGFWKGVSLAGEVQRSVSVADLGPKVKTVPPP